MLLWLKCLVFWSIGIFRTFYWQLLLYTVVLCLEHDGISQRLKVAAQWIILLPVWGVKAIDMGQLSLQPQKLISFKCMEYIRKNACCIFCLSATASSRSSSNGIQFVNEEVDLIRPGFLVHQEHHGLFSSNVSIRTDYLTAPPMGHPDLDSKERNTAPSTFLP